MFAATQGQTKGPTPEFEAAAWHQFPPRCCRCRLVHRFRWMRAMLLRDNRIGDVNIIGNLVSGRLLQRGWAPRATLWLGFGVMALGSTLAFATFTDAWPWLRFAGMLLFSGVGGLVPGTLFSLAVRLAPGETITVNGYAFRFDGVKDHQGPNYVAQRGTLEVSHDGFVEVLHPEKRIYRVQQNPMTEAAISGNAFRDLYVALGEPLDAGAWAVRIYHKPMIRWVWFGALMMAFGGLLSILDKRYRLKVAGGR